MAGSSRARDDMFVVEYLKDLNAERAANAVGFSATTARTHAHTWVSRRTGLHAKPYIYDAIRAKLGARMAKLDLSSERILEEIARVAFFNVADILGNPGQKIRDYDLSNLTIEQAAAIGEIIIDRRGKTPVLRAKPHNKMEALTLLAKYRNLLSPDAALSVTVNSNVTLSDRVARAKARASKS